jgi:hypothetical protein
MAQNHHDNESTEAEIQRLKAELKISEEIRINERESHQYRVEAIRNDAKFYNRDGFWLLFWIALPFLFVALGSFF